MESQEQTKINPWLTTVHRWFSRLIRIYFGLIVSLRLIADIYSDFYERSIFQQSLVY
jgi:hypothetical protein